MYHQLRRASIALVALLVLATYARSADFVVPEQRILAADDVVPFGELVDLKVSSIKDKPANLIATSYNWKVIDLTTGQEKRYKESGDSIFFGSGMQKKQLKVICAVTHLYAVKDGDKLKEVATRTVILMSDVFIGDKPGPAPPTPPTPTPEPTFVDGRFKLARFAYDAAKAHVAIGDSRGKASAGMVAAYQGIAAAIAAGTLTDVKSILEKTAIANTEVVKAFYNGQTTPWKAFTSALEDKLFDLYETGKLKVPADYADAWREIAQGLEAVK